MYALELLGFQKTRKTQKTQRTEYKGLLETNYGVQTTLQDAFVRKFSRIMKLGVEACHSGYHIYLEHCLM